MMKILSSIVAVTWSISTVACVSPTPNPRLHAEFSDVIDRPSNFAGKRVSVTGYLVYKRGGFQLLEPKWANCYGNESERRMIVTSLKPRLGDERQQDIQFNGHLAQVSGVFLNDGTPWPKNELLDPPDYIAVGPLKWARIDQVFGRGCDTRLENQR